MIDDRLIDAGEVPIAIRDFGGPGQPVLLLHGGGGNLVATTGLARALRTRHRVVSMDLRGHGRSGEGTWSWDAALGDVGAVVDQLGLDRPAVVGHSVGGMIAALWGERHPDAAGVISLAGTPPPSRTDQLPGLERNQAAADLAALTDVFDRFEATSGQPLDADQLAGLIESQRAAARDLGASEKLAVEELRRNVEQRDGRTMLRPSRQVAGQLRAAMRELDVVALYAATRCPLLVVLATRDLPQEEPFADLYAAYRSWTAERVAATARTTPRMRHLLLPDASHAMLVEKPDRLASLIADFLPAR